MKLGDGAQTFGPGTYSTGATDFGLYADAITGATLTVDDSSINGTSISLAVDPGAATKYRMTAGLAHTAGVGFDTTVTAYDAHD